MDVENHMVLPYADDEVDYVDTCERCGEDYRGYCKDCNPRPVIDGKVL